MLTLRLRIKDDHITEAETICPGPAAADGTFDLGAGAAEAEHARPLFSADLKTEEKRDRWQLIWAADLHFQGIERGNGDIVPFAESCVKIENGMQLTSNPAFTFPAVSPSGADVPNFAAMACRDQFNTHIWDTDLVTDRRYPVVDEERGIVVAFGMYNQYIRARCADVVDVGVVCPPTNVEPYSLAFAEAFKIQAGMIEAIESIFTVLPQLKTRGVW